MHRQDATDHFLHGLTAADSQTSSVPQATLRTSGNHLVATVGQTQVSFPTDHVGGQLKLGDCRFEFPDTVQFEGGSPPGQPQRGNGE